MNVANTLALEQQDAGTGMLIGDPFANLSIFHNDLAPGIARTLPILSAQPADAATSPTSASAPAGPSSIASIATSLFGGPSTPAPNTVESTIESGTSLNNAGSWSSAVSSLGPSTSILQSLQQSGSSGGVNLQLGPQADFAPVSGTTTTSSGSGVGAILFIAIAIVGALVWYHFKKKKEAKAAA